MTQIIAHKFANNEIRLRLVAKPESKLQESAEQKRVRRLWEKTQASTWIPEMVVGAECPVRPPLDIISEFQRASKKPQRGGWGFAPRRTRFNRQARHKLLEAGAIVDTEFHNQASFLTGTLPGSTPEALRGISLWSGYIVNRLQQWIRRKTGELFSFYSWEWQKRGALHLHYCVAHMDTKVLDDIESGFKPQWIKILRDVSKRSEFDLFEREGKNASWIAEESIQADARRVEKSAAAYISKYVGKGATEGISYKDDSCYPSRWWGCSRPMLHRVLQQRDATGTTQGDYQTAKDKFTQIVDEFAKTAVCTYSMGDRYHPQNRTQIMYFSGELLTETWENIKALLTRTTCNIEAKVMSNKSASKLSAISKIMTNRRMRKRFFAEMKEQELDAYALRLYMTGRRGYEIGIGRMTASVWVQRRAEEWLPLLKTYCQ